ncbi:type I phosphodiesterase/nucleotide pyrophosphatase [Rhizobium lentis]|uniref:alkaline phosphatase family protein n=1 Tax=Rhizobium lentis TaxID=1138194 RepID=UPI001C83B71F|nr:alkaline phosphatase family protein [Rhizobium lentis]MBX5101243.1 type I phosphodiesterase/nucleotide pyrophosphatase [Rhizobium lentis]
MKFIAVVFDGLRPDQLSETVTPNLCELARIGLVLKEHTASFPSETRVSSAAIATGSHGSGHGIVANKFFANGQPIDGSSLPALLSLGGTEGGVMTSMAIGEVLSKNGRTMLAVGSQSQGSWGLSNWGNWQSGGPAYWVHDPERFTSNAAIRRIAATFPPLPKDEHPALQTAKRVVDGFLSYVASETIPDLSLLWISEPDVSYHQYGLVHPSARAVLHEVDKEFGRILDWWGNAKKRERLQLIAASDHGHAIIGKTISVTEHLLKCGFKVDETLDGGADVVVKPMRSVNLWVRNGDLPLLKDIHACLAAQSWYGVGFTRTMKGDEPQIEGTLPHSAVMFEHSRSPDLSFVLADCATHPGCDPEAVYYDGPYPVGVGMHGGLTSYELSSLGIFAGDWFRGGSLNTPTGIVDFAPTILSGLGLPIPSTVQGRIMEEAITDGDEGAEEIVEDATLAVRDTLKSASIHRARYRGRLYLKGTAYRWNGQGG